MKYLIAIAFLAVASAYAPRPVQLPTAALPQNIFSDPALIRGPKRDFAPLHVHEPVSRSELETIRIALPVEAVPEKVQVVDAPLPQRDDIYQVISRSELETIRIALPGEFVKVVDSPVVLATAEKPASEKVHVADAMRTQEVDKVRVVDAPVTKEASKVLVFDAPVTNEASKVLVVDAPVTKEASKVLVVDAPVTKEASKVLVVDAPRTQEVKVQVIDTPVEPQAKEASPVVLDKVRVVESPLPMQPVLQEQFKVIDGPEIFQAHPYPKRDDAFLR